MHNAQTLTRSTQGRSLLAALIVAMITITIKVGGSAISSPAPNGIEITITDEAGSTVVPVAMPTRTATPSSATTATPSSSTTTTPRSSTSGH